MLILNLIWDTFKNYVISHPYKFALIVIVVVVVLLLVLIIYWSIKKKVYKYMAQAESGAILASNLKGIVEKIQASDWDDRMVYVVANLISNLPIIRFLFPTKIIAKLLNKLVQGTFDKVKDLLDARVAKALAKADPKKIMKLNEISSDVFEITDEVVKHIMEQINVSDIIAKKINEKVEKPLKVIEETIPEVKETVEEVKGAVEETVGKAKEELSEFLPVNVDEAEALDVRKLFGGDFLNE